MSEQSSDLQEKLRKAMDRVHELIKATYVDGRRPPKPAILAALEELDAVRKEIDQGRKSH